MKLSLVGGEYAAMSPASQAETCVNLFPELVDGMGARGPLNPAAQGKSPGALYGTPGRSMFAALGGTNIRDLYSVNGRIWAVNNTDLVELDYTGAVVSRHGTMIDDGLPAQIIWNGHQICVISGGLVYVDNGATLVAQTFAPSTGTVTTSVPTGTVNTSGTAVSWNSGDTFEIGSSWVGRTITINAVAYTVASVTSQFSLTLTSSAGVQTGVAYSTNAGGVIWQSGDEFVTDGTWVGRNIVINGTPYVIAAVQTSKILVLTISAGVQAGVSYSVVGSNVTATGGCYLDGYVIIQRPRGGTPDLGRQFNLSALNDATDWSELDFGVKESYPDYTQQLLAANEQLYVFGLESLEVWQNTGGSLTNPLPLQRIPGSVSRFGARSPWSAVALDGNVYFLGGDGSGWTRAYVLNGWSPQPVSTPAQEAAWNSQTNPFGQFAVGFGYQEEGHSFYMVCDCTGVAPEQTWAFDQNTGVWHQRYRWNGATFAFNETQFHCFFSDLTTNASKGGGYHLVGSVRNGNIYLQSLNIKTDAGNDIKWQRTLGWLYEENQRIVFGRFTLEIETGGVVFGSAPTVTLSWSDDRGATFKGNLSTGIGTAGQTNVRVYWTRTGMSRGRAFRISGIVPGASGGYRPALMDASCDLVVCS